jgi:Uma2 family endonuclease
MPVFISDPRFKEALRIDEASAEERLEEAWEGLPYMPPLANDEHQQIASRLGGIFFGVIDHPGLGEIRVGVNVSDREEDWEHNYRCPDVAAFLLGGRARNCGTHWCGGPDFVVEVLSPRDGGREKLVFYAAIGVREVLLIDRDPWRLELYRLQGGSLMLAGEASLEHPGVLASQVLPFTFTLRAATGRPMVEVSHAESLGRWLV